MDLSHYWSNLEIRIHLSLPHIKLLLPKFLWQALWRGIMRNQSWWYSSENKKDRPFTTIQQMCCLLVNRTQPMNSGSKWNAPGAQTWQDCLGCLLHYYPLFEHLDPHACQQSSSQRMMAYTWIQLWEDQWCHQVWELHHLSLMWEPTIDISHYKPLSSSSLCQDPEMSWGLLSLSL